MAWRRFGVIFQIRWINRILNVVFRLLNIDYENMRFQVDQIFKI